MSETIKLTVNGIERTIQTVKQRRLLDVLREDLQLTGSKYGCGEGQCGACLVLLDGKPTRTCILPVSAAVGKAITTIEGLSDGDNLHPVQEAFLEEGAMQCGYCTSGMILSASALLQEKPHPSDDEIVSAMNGHICRCNGYPKIVRAIQRAAEKTRS